MDVFTLNLTSAYCVKRQQTDLGLVLWVGSQPGYQHMWPSLQKAALFSPRIRLLFAESVTYCLEVKCKWNGLHATTLSWASWLFKFKRHFNLLIMYCHFDHHPDITTLSCHELHVQTSLYWVVMCGHFDSISSQRHHLRLSRVSCSNITLLSCHMWSFWSPSQHHHIDLSWAPRRNITSFSCHMCPFWSPSWHHHIESSHISGQSDPNPQPPNWVVPLTLSWRGRCSVAPVVLLPPSACDRAPDLWRWGIITAAA